MDIALKVLHLVQVPGIKNAVTTALDKAGFVYVRFEITARDAFEDTVNSLLPDVILAEHQLPDLNAAVAFRELLKTRLGIPFILITDAAMEESAVELVDAGADDYIFKDRPGRLPTAIRNALARYRLQEQHRDLTYEVRNREARYRALIEHSGDAVLILDEQGKFSYVSPSVKNVLGYDQQEAMQIDLLSISHPESASIVADIMQKSLQNPGVLLKGHTGRMLHKDGSWRWIEATIINLLHDPAVKGIVDNFRDVTEQKAASQLLARSASNLNAIIEHTDAFIYSLDQNFKFITFNKALQNSLKQFYDIEINPGDDVFDSIRLIDPLDIPHWHGWFSSALLGEHVKFEKKIKGNGSFAYHRYLISPIWENEVVIGLSCFVTDVTKEKRAYERNRFKANLLNTIGQAAIATDLEGVITYWNKAADKIYGWTRQEVIGKNIDQIIPTPMNVEEAAQIMAALRSGQSWSGEFNVQRKDGMRFPVLVTDTPVYDEQHNLTGIIGISSDISEKKALEDLLDKATSLARIGTFDIDLVNDVLFWSPMTHEIHEVEPGYIPDKMGSRHFYQKGENRNTIRKAYYGAMEQNRPFDEELQIVTAKGNERWVRVIGEPERVKGQCVRIYGSIQDIDKIKRAELEVLRMDEEKNLILESIGDAFFGVDRNWIISYWNKEAEKLLKRSKQDVLHTNLWDTVRGLIQCDAAEKFKEAMQHDQALHYEDYFAMLNKWLEVSAYPTPAGLAVFFKDITDRKLSEIHLNELNLNLQDYTRELILSNKGLEQFSYIISHNLRAPVANIIGLADLLGVDTYPPDLREEFLRSLLTNVKRLDDVIIDLNTILQVKREVSEKKEVVNLEELVFNIQSSIQDLVSKEKVEIYTDFQEVAELTTLKSYLQSIFYNLIVNSIKYHQPGLAAMIRIRSYNDGGKVCISFRDNGMGIDLNKRKEQVFGLYKRFHQHVEGKGMGLFMVKTQVEMLGGTIAIESEINKGTEFIIELNADDIHISEK